MSKFKGTKGVWEIEEIKGYHCDDNGIKINPIGFSFNEWDFDGDSDEIEPNAKLIAAAPELLEALQEAIGLLIESTEFDILTRYRDKVSCFELLIDKATE